MLEQLSNVFGHLDGIDVVDVVDFGRFSSARFLQCSLSGLNKVETGRFSLEVHLSAVCVVVSRAPCSHYRQLQQG